MKELADVLAAEGRSKAERSAAQEVFLKKRSAIWKDIQEGRFPVRYISANNRTCVGAPVRTAIRCDFLLASKAALGSKYAADRLSDLAQRELLFYVLRDREVFPKRTGKKFYCCPKCTSKLYECVSAKVFRYIDNVKWKREIETGQQRGSEAGERDSSASNSIAPRFSAATYASRGCMSASRKPATDFAG